MLSCSFFSRGRFVFPAKWLTFIITQYLIHFICILPVVVWSSSGRWAISWFCLQHCLWTLFPLWDFPVTKQQLEENIKLPVLSVLNFAFFSLILSSSLTDEISPLHNTQLNLKREVCDLNPLRQEDKTSLVFLDLLWQGLCYFKKSELLAITKTTVFNAA